MADVLDVDSTYMSLTEQDPGERRRIWQLNGASWKGPLSLQDYVLREDHLRQQALTRNGGARYWLLTDSREPPGQRPILSSCETLQKTVLIKQAAGPVEKCITYGIASVFCESKLRGRGYPSKMMHLLAEKMDLGRDNIHPSAFTVLYSDIGRDFYAKFGWQPYDSDYITLPPQKSAVVDVDLKVQQVVAEDVEELCQADEKRLYAALETAPAQISQTIVSLVPDAATIKWHHAREDYVVNCLHGLGPQNRGAICYYQSDKKAWCLWSRTFGDDPTQSSVLYILRLVIDEIDEPLGSGDSVEGAAKVIQASDAAICLLQAAQIEATKSKIKEIQIWNPSPLIITAARRLHPATNLMTRDHDSIACLRLNPHRNFDHDIHWVANQRFGWC